VTRRANALGAGVHETVVQAVSARAARALLAV
jgi:hypothetical protein